MVYNDIAKIKQIIIADPDVLIALASADLLDALISLNYPVVIVDMVKYMTDYQLQNFHTQHIYNNWSEWINSRSGTIHRVSTDTGYLFLKSRDELQNNIDDLTALSNFDRYIENGVERALLDYVIYDLRPKEETNLYLGEDNILPNLMMKASYPYQFMSLKMFINEFFPRIDIDPKDSIQKIINQNIFLSRSIHSVNRAEID